MGFESFTREKLLAIYSTLKGGIKNELFSEEYFCLAPFSLKAVSIEHRASIRVKL
jgi:hypothetical protein